jgi:hypothetical protein
LLAHRIVTRSHHRVILIPLISRLTVTLSLELPIITHFRERLLI